MWILFKSLIILSSVFTLRYLSSDPFWKPKEGVFIILGFIFLASCWLAKKTNRYIFENRWLSLFFIYVILLFGWNFIWPFINDVQTLNITDSTTNLSFSIPFVLPEIWYTVLPTLNVILAILLIYHLVEHTDSITLRWVGVIKVVCWLGFGLAIYSILQFLGCDQIFPTFKGAFQRNHMFTFMGNRMLTSNIIASIIPLFMIFKSKKYYIAMGVCLLTLCFFKSAFNSGVAVLGISTILLLQGRWKIVLGMVLIILTFMLIFRNYTAILLKMTNGSFQIRIGLIKRVLSEPQNSILTGHGLGSMFKDFAPISASWTRFRSSHNMMVDIFYETGLVGIGLVLGYLFNLLNRLRRVFSNNQQSMLLIGLCGGFLSYLMMSMASFPHRIAPLALLGIIYMAGIEVHLSKRRTV